MNIGNIVEYIDQQKIICAVVLQVKKQRLRLLTENNREVNLSAGRLAHLSNEGLDISASRDFLVSRLKNSAKKRRELTQQIDIKELWELLHEEDAAYHRHPVKGDGQGPIEGVERVEKAEKAGGPADHHAGDLQKKVGRYQLGVLDRFVQ